MAADERRLAFEETALARLLNRARGEGFVGRSAQIASFDEAIRGSTSARIIVVHGPGGIGKTTLLDALGRQARAAGRTTVYLDAREVAPTPEAVTAALASRARAAGCVDGDQPAVLLIDGCELLEPLHRWLRDGFLPSRPAEGVTVLAGRDAPEPGWWLDPGWRRLTLVHELGELAPAESIDLLAGLGVEAGRRERLAGLGRGHPLALALLAEACADGPVPEQLADDPDVVGRLCRAIVDDVPDAAHRTGLATCAHATRMTHDLLSHTVGPDADAVWAWLESRPYVRRGEIGLFLHDVVREVFEAELAHRAPEAYAALHRQLRAYFLAQVADPQQPQPDRAAAEILLLHRRAPPSVGLDRLRDGGLPTVAHAGGNERSAIMDIIRAEEGPESAELARRWLAEQPQSAYRTRSADGFIAFAVQSYLPVAGGLAHDDPVAREILATVQRLGPLRPGERININRFAGATGTDQRHPMVLLVNGVSCILEWARQPAAWSFIVTLEEEVYGEYFEFLGMSRLLELDYFGRPLAGYGWDRRRFPPAAFFELTATRELSGDTGPPPASALRPAPLDRPAFAAAVHDALPDVRRPDRLAGSALLTTALVNPWHPEPIRALQDLLVTIIAGLTPERRGTDYRRILQRTYLKGTPSQEVAADLLRLPFSTYRRHLARAEERLVDLLWAIEIGVHPAPGPKSAATGNEQEVDTE